MDDTFSDYLSSRYRRNSAKATESIIKSKPGDRIHFVLEDHNNSKVGFSVTNINKKIFNFELQVESSSKTQTFKLLRKDISKYFFDR